MNVYLHIERVVLDVPATERQRMVLEQTLGEQLHGLIEQRGLSPALLEGGAIDQIQGGQVTSAAEGGDWGNDLAAAILEGIGPRDPSA